MIYSKFQDLELSALGMGTMRLPVVDGKNENIDAAHAEKMIDYAMAKGINYYDTAWGYHEGTSESVVGGILQKYPRESFYLASKFPGYDLKNMPKAQEIFEKQLEKCRVDRFDFYLIHNVCEINIDAYLDPKFGILEYFKEQKKNGRIGHLGFSFHGSVGVLEKFLGVYGDYMEFGQLQLNWVDWEFQNSREKAAILEKRNIPVWVMEPLRGGMLAKLAPEHEEKLKALRPEESVVGWAYRFLQSLPQVKVTLTGASSLEQLKENIAAFEKSEPLTGEEMQTLFDTAREMTAKIALPCTACRYCTSHCPKGLDIPMLLELYNEHAFTGGGFIAPMALAAVQRGKRPKDCIGCRACEQVCPQGIKISEAMQDFSNKL